MPPLKKDSSADYDQGTGKYRTLSEQQDERTLAAPATEPAGRVSAASESDAKAVASDAEVTENKSLAPRKTVRKSK